MTKVSVVLYYWISVIAALLFAKTRGLADNDGAIIKILIIVSLLYFGIVFISYSWGKSKAKRKSENMRYGATKKFATGRGNKKVR